MALMSTDRVLDGALLANLMRRIAAEADKSAFAQLFGIIAPKLKGYLMRLGADDGTAEELVQDVMLTIWRRARDFDPARASVTTWVYTIARNRRIDRLRREKRPDLDLHEPLLATEPEQPADFAIELREQEARLRVALGTLPKEQADLLFMAFYEDKAHTGIAIERDLPLGTVKSRLRLALQRLRKALSDDEA
jgi:RNA polymerase sigma-70 factor (ECF subfamily)